MHILKICSTCGIRAATPVQYHGVVCQLVTISPNLMLCTMKGNVCTSDVMSIKSVLSNGFSSTDVMLLRLTHHDSGPAVEDLELLMRSTSHCSNPIDFSRERTDE